MAIGRVSSAAVGAGEGAPAATGTAARRGFLALDTAAAAIADFGSRYVASQSVRAAPMSAADAKRALGSTAMARCTIAPSALGMVGLTARGSGGGASMRATATA
jgi:hypothetical protein